MTDFPPETMSAGAPHRIVSLLPAATEMVVALGAVDQLVGRSHACDHPWEVRPLPAVTRPKVSVDAPSLELHESVVKLSGEGQSLFELDVPRLRELAPTVILAQDQCAVCAITPKDLDAALADWPGRKPEILRLSPTRLVDLWADLQRIAGVLGLADAGRGAIAPLKARVVAVIERTALLQKRPSVACLEWLDPLMGAGNWIPELVHIAGGHPLFGEPGVHSDWITWENLLLQDPQVLVSIPCGFDLDRVRQETRRLAARPDWTKLRAARNGKVFLADASAYFNRPGPRLVDSLELLAEMLHPDLFNPARYKGEAWEPFTQKTAV